MTWYDAFLLFAGACAGWGAKEGWEENGLSEAIGNAFLHLVFSPFVPFAVVWYLWERRQRRRTERDAFYAPYGGYAGYRQHLREQRKSG